MKRKSSKFAWKEGDLRELPDPEPKLDPKPAPDKTEDR